MYIYVYLFVIISCGFDQWVNGHRFNKDFVIDY
jgi:hypothetical protein